MWNYFQGFYIITIQDEQSERIRNIKKNLESAGVFNYEIYKFPSAKKYVNDGGNDITLLNIISHAHCDETCLNIAQNHYSLIELAYKRGLDNIVIMEDDAEFELPIVKEQLAYVTDWLKNNNWDIFYFGYIPWPFIYTIPVNKYIVRVFTPLLAHCYCLNRSGMAKILQDKKANHIDLTLAWSNLKKYAIFPSISFQSIPPALARVAMKKMGINVSFKSMSKGIEYLGIAMYIFILLLIIYIVHKFYNRVQK